LSVFSLTKVGSTAQLQLQRCSSTLTISLTLPMNAFQKGPICDVGGRCICRVGQQDSARWLACWLRGPVAQHA